MNFHLRWTSPARAAILMVVLFAAVWLVKLGKATGAVGKEDLSGTWQATLTGDTGCGITTDVLTFTLNAAGTGPATFVGHSAGCGNSTSTGQTFTVTSMNSNGSGIAGVTCGSGCGFTFHIQVSPDRSVFNMVDVTDPMNFLEGVAIHQ